MKTVLIHGKGESHNQLYSLLSKHRVDEVWALNNMGCEPVPTRHWEIHEPIHFSDKQIIDSYFKYNGTNPRFYPDFRIVRYKDLQLDKLIKLFRGRYFGNTISYQIGTAILEGFNKIILCGCDKYAITEISEVDYVKYALSIAKRMGITIVLPQGSTLDLSEHVLKIRNRLTEFDYR